MPATGTEGFREAAKRLKGADKVILGELAIQMRRTAKPVVAEIRDTVRKSKGSSSRGGAASVERQLHALSRARRIHDEATGWVVPRRVRALQRKLVKASSLRESIASATGSTVSTGPDRVNLTFRVRSAGMPPSQRKLPKKWNLSGGWRHPVFGNKDVWVKQTGGPYFDRTIHEHTDELRAGVVVAMEAAAEKIIHGGTTP